jgi:hypothetical protein
MLPRMHGRGPLKSSVMMPIVTTIRKSPLAFVKLESGRFVAWCLACQPLKTADGFSPDQAELGWLSRVQGAPFGFEL